jgi:hypothetical protein
MAFPKTVVLRSPRESLGGYIVLPRLIDKVRLLANGQLPQPVARIMKCSHGCKPMRSRLLSRINGPGRSRSIAIDPIRH